MAVSREELRSLAEPQFQIGQHEWPTGTLIRVAIDDADGDRSFPLVETNRKEGRKAVVVIARRIQSEWRQQYGWAEHFRIEQSLSKGDDCESTEIVGRFSEDGECWVRVQHALVDLEPAY